MGWRTLHQEIKDFKPDVIGCGENHALYTNEALKFFEMCKDAAPQAKTIDCGGHFSNMSHRYAGFETIDAICIGEGEKTFSELCHAFAESDPDLSKIDGIAFGDGSEVVQTAPRKLIADLDSLPMPAYDLMPMAQYGCCLNWTCPCPVPAPTPTNPRPEDHCSCPPRVQHPCAPGTFGPKTQKPKYLLCQMFLLILLPATYLEHLMLH